MNMLLRPHLSAEEFEDMPDTDGAELIDGLPQEREMGANPDSSEAR